MSCQENNFERQSGTFSYSVCSQSCTLMPVSSRPGTIKLSASVADCNCTRAAPDFPKLCQLTCYPKPVTCPIPDSVTPSVEICECPEVGEDMTPSVPTCESEEEGTHEHKYCSTSCCDHNSQGVQPSESSSDWYIEGCSSPLPPNLQKPHIEPRLKDYVPQSVEELKASISGLTGLDQKPGNLLGCEYIEFRCQISTSLPCLPTDSQVSCASSPPHRLGFSLTIEPNDHRFCTNPNDCKHSREFCPPPPSPPPVCPPRPLLPPPSLPVQPPPPYPPRHPQPQLCPGSQGSSIEIKPLCPPPPKPVRKPPSKACPSSEASSAETKPVCPPPPCPPTPRPPTPPSPPPSPTPPKRCAGGCENCLYPK